MDTLKLFCSKLWKCNFVIQFFISLLFIVSIFNIFYLKAINDFWSLKDLILGFISGIIVFFIIFKNIKCNKDCLEKIFLSIAIPLSIGYMIFVIPSKNPDEPIHFTRIFNMANGDIFIDKNVNEEVFPIEYKNLGDNVNKYVDLFNFKAQTTKIESNQDYKCFNASMLYFPTVYLAPTIANVIGNLINLDLFNLMYLLRLANVIVFLAFGYFTIKFLPFGKLLMMTYLCLPMFLHQAGSVSADCFINSACLLFIAYSLKLLVKEEAFTLKEKILYFIFALLATLNKSTYMPLIFIGCLLLFNMNYKRRNKKDLIFIISTICIMVALSGIWYFYGAGYKDTREAIVVNNVNASEQLHSIISHPTEFIQILLNYLNSNKTILLLQALGNSLGPLTINVDTLFSILYLILLLFAPFLEDCKFSLRTLQKIWLLLITIGISLIVIVALYLTWSPVGAKFISGVQGRYFLPVLVLPLLCMVRKNKYLSFKHTILFYCLSIICLNCFSLEAIFKFFI